MRRAQLRRVDVFHSCGPDRLAPSASDHDCLVRIDEVMRDLEGFASREELLALKCRPEMIDMSIYYRRIVPIRRGQYALPGLDPRFVRALRAGGRLACVSALSYYADADADADRAESIPVHVLVPYGISHLPTGDSVVHWTRRPLKGSRLVVSQDLAERQARTCRALGGSWPDSNQLHLDEHRRVEEGQHMQQ